MLERKQAKSKLYNQVINSKQLESAWRHVRKNGLGSDSDHTKKEIKKFDEHWESELKKIRKQVQAGIFDFGGSRGHKSKKPGKQAIRPLVLFPVAVRVLQRSILNVLQEKKGIKKYLTVESSFGGLQGKTKGVPGAVRKIVELAEAIKASYIIRSDIVSFFTKIPLDSVIAKIKEDLKASDDFIELLEAVIKPELENLNQLGEDRKLFEFDEEGTPQGCCLSPLIANIFLHDFDTQMSQDDIRCIRYLDDFIILAKNQHAANGGFKKAKSLLSSLNLEIHDPAEQTGKASEGHINKPFEFLGLEFDFKNKAIRPTSENQAKLKNKIYEILLHSIKAIKASNGPNEKKDSMLSTLWLVSNKVKGWGATFASACGEYHDQQVFVEIEKNIHGKIFNYFQKVSSILQSNENRSEWSRIIGVHLLSDCKAKDKSGQ